MVQKDGDQRGARRWNVYMYVVAYLSWRERPSKFKIIMRGRGIVRNEYIRPETPLHTDERILMSFFLGESSAHILTRALSYIQGPDADHTHSSWRSCE